MLIYIVLFLIPLVFYISMGKRGAKSRAFLGTYLTLLALFVGMGDMLGGYDRYIYGELFDSMADVTRAGGNPWESESFEFYRSEFGYGTFCALLTFVTANRYIFIFITTLVIFFLLYKSIEEYTEDYPMAVIVFMGLWFFFTFTYLRQVLSATIIWFSVRHVINRNLARFLLVWFIAYSFHNSAILFLPVYFIATKRIPMKMVLYFMAFILLFGMSPIPDALFQTYGEVAVDRMGAAGHRYNAEQGFRIAYFMEAVTFLYLIALRYEKLLEDRRGVVLTNIALMFCAVLLFFVKSENGGRLSWFFMIGIIATLSRMDVLERVKGYRPIVTILCTWLFIRILTGWGILLSPYKTFLTDGVRKGDFIWDIYEYDHEYDDDKLYKL